MKHCKKWHLPVLEALQRLVAETPGNEVSAACKDYVRELVPPPDGSLDGFVSRRDPMLADLEVSALLWFIDGLIPFAQFDNPLWKDLCRRLRSSSENLSSSTTVIHSVLPALYSYVSNLLRSHLASWSSFYTTFDSWTKYGLSFVSQHYHGISSADFTFRILLGDLIPFTSQKFEETLSGALYHRQEYWTSGLTITRAGGLADTAGNVQAAGRTLFGEDDMLKCQCHLIALAYKDAAEGARFFAQDFKALSGLCTFIAQNSNVSKSLSRFQEAQELGEYSILLPNDTRWNGSDRMLKRCILLEMSLSGMRHMDEVIKLGSDLKDFLEPPFFDRIRGYSKCLDILNQASEFYQQQNFPVGCFVPIVSNFLLAAFVPSEMDNVFLQDFKTALHSSLSKRLNYIFDSPSIFVLSAMFHPGVAKFLLSSFDSEFVDSIFEAILAQANLLDPESVPFVTPSLQVYRKLINNINEPVPIVSLPGLTFSSGLFYGYNHMDFWKSVAKNTMPQSRYLQALIPVAAMLLAVPAAEAVDEFAFSSAGSILTKGRVSMLPQTLEQVTVIRRFIQINLVSPKDVLSWLNEARKEAKK